MAGTGLGGMPQTLTAIDTPPPTWMRGISGFNGMGTGGMLRDSGPDQSRYGMMPSPSFGASRFLQPMGGMFGQGPFGGGLGISSITHQDHAAPPPSSVGEISQDPGMLAYQPNYSMFWDPMRMLQAGLPSFGSPWYRSMVAPGTQPPPAPAPPAAPAPATQQQIEDLVRQVRYMDIPPEHRFSGRFTGYTDYG